MTMSSDSFRAFFAIDLPDEVKKTIASALQPLRKKHFQQSPQNNWIKWIKPENIHLTLCFLGGITFEQYQKIDEKIKKLIKSVAPFKMKLTTVTPFPSLKKFHTLSVNSEPLQPVKNLASIITDVVTTCGIQTEKRPFRSHITIAYIKNQKKIDRKILREIKIPTIHFEVTAIKLFKSEPQEGGSFYTSVAIYNFK